MPFTDQLQHWARKEPQRTAVVVGGARLSFAQLVAEAREHLLPQPGAGAALAVIDEPNGTRLAARFAGAVAGHGTAAVLDAGWPDALKAATAARARAWAAAQPATSAGPPGFHDGPPASTFLLGFSSGTSGVPKAFTRSRASWEASFREGARHFGLTAADVTLAPGPMAASMNLYALGEAFFTGSTFVSLPQFSPDAALHAIRHDAPTRLVATPTVLSLLARRGLDTGQGAGALTSIVCAGSALSGDVTELAQRWAPHAVIHQYYGASELGFVAASRLVPGEPDVPGSLCAGSAFPGAELSVRGSDGLSAGAGECGSIYVRGPYVSNGYAWGDDGLAFNLLPDPAESGGPWYTVHDQGFVDPAGRLHVVGRASDMIVTGGINVYPQQVEAALEPAGGPGTVLVAGLPDDVRGQRVVAALFPGPGPAGEPPLSVEQLVAACRRHAAGLPGHQRPTRYYALSEQPLTDRGKISRALLQAWITEGDARARRIH
ncbi:class I adenylate-forming enzyme family protein [Arthrobacter sp. STN4]|uniref:class I adenylate-forming enzyme family protein n=1 Tax=Arthrobacter sp. STN4 TaxID=2923276 RepID=UPI00211A57A4|nr:AMP-binding protein [Arthrobacter sp. STN4]MCQ9164676.1 AMP-binding protein [Arthrobacter sp. STN4]